MSNDDLLDSLCAIFSDAAAHKRSRSKDKEYIRLRHRLEDLSRKYRFSSCMYEQTLRMIADKLRY